MSPSMDIQVASNFERLLYNFYQGDGDKINSMMDEFLRVGKLKIEDKALEAFRESFWSGVTSEIETERTIANSLAKYDALVCPHTAVGLHVAEKFQSYNNRVPMITLATAHPSKFPESVRRATGRNPELPQQYSDLLSREELFAEKDKDLEDLKTYIKMRLEN